LAAEPGLQSIHSRSCVTANSQFRADAAAVSEIASGSQHNTMSAISHRIARSLSAFAPTKLGHARRLPTVSVRLPV